MKEHMYIFSILLAPYYLLIWITIAIFLYEFKIRLSFIDLIKHNLFLTLFAGALMFLPYYLFISHLKREFLQIPLPEAGEYDKSFEKVAIIIIVVGISLLLLLPWFLDKVIFP